MVEIFRIDYTDRQIINSGYGPDYRSTCSRFGGFTVDTLTNRRFEWRIENLVPLDPEFFWCTSHSSKGTVWFVVCEGGIVYPLEWQRSEYHDEK